MHKENHKEGKDGERYYLLDNLEVPEGEGAAMNLATYAVGRHLEAVLKECYTPADEDNGQHAKLL